MELAVGRVAWIKKRNPDGGYNLKFATTEKEILDQFSYPPESVRLAMSDDNRADRFIKQTQMGNDEM
jgi:hypothetical protein